ncbi:hypothetical protein [Streptomyces albus]|uniref:hypothetical protein n=1 Tax=Streptomyces sp. NRRL F-5917 TaxID=1463873 RepID=UPI0013312365|nr:hypothetical protein [Streptomyces sp. NRRL F-5917]
MGSELRRQLREALGPHIKGLQRAVALEIADDARWDDAWNFSPENGRRSKARLSDLVRWTAAKDERAVREMLRRLAAAGWEFRIPIGKGKDGRPLYAVPGTAMQFRVPDFVGPTVVGPTEQGPTVVGPTGDEGPTVVAQGPTVVAQGPTVVGPPSLSSPTSPNKPAGSPEGPTTVGPSIPDFATELASALSSHGIHVRWNLRDAERDELRDLIADRGLAAMTATAVRAAQRTDVETIRYFLPGWRELPPAAPQNGSRPNLRVFPGGHQPYSNSAWEEAADPEEAARIPHCGHPDCDPVTRLRDTTTHDGQPWRGPCDDCHPALRFG